MTSATEPPARGAAPSFCAGCGAALKDGAQFCGQCGAVVIASPQPAAQAQLCPACGAPLEPNVAFCRACGRAVATVPTAPVAGEPPAKRGLRSPMPAGLIGGAVVAVLAVAGFLLFSGGGGGGGTPGGATTTPGGDGASGDGAAKGEFTLGPRIDYGSQKVDKPGGVMTLDLPGDPLNGLELTVPKDSYDDSRDFKVSYRPITKSSFDSRINAVSPLITVENGGDYANDLMTVKVPAKVPAGQFAMGFFYDETTHVLEAMPLVSEDADSVTVTTRHFSDFFISLIPEDVLRNLTIDSGFKPGVDDWEFANYGSYIEPDGHCAGMSISAIWYYYERKQQDGRALYNRYDNYRSKEPATPNIWQDDALAYRMVSGVQRDLDWDSSLHQIIFATRGTSDSATFLAFAYSMYVSHAPQILALYATGGGGHAVVAYKVEPTGIWIADPNWPGRQSAARKIDYSVIKGFAPYSSAPNAKADRTPYDKVVFEGVTALVPWARLGVRFQQMESGLIGIGIYPYDDLWVTTLSAPDEVRLDDGLVFKDPAFNITRAEVNPYVEVFRDGAQLERTPAGWPLKAGENKLGIALYGKIKGGYSYIDFIRVTVEYKPEAPKTEFEAPLVYSLSPGIRASNPLNLVVDGNLQGPENVPVILKQETQPQIMDVFVTTADKVTLNFTVSADLKKGTTWEELNDPGDYGQSVRSQVTLTKPRIKLTYSGKTLAEFSEAGGSYTVPAATGTRQVNGQFRLEWDYEQTFYDAKGVKLGTQTGTTGVYFLHLIVDSP